jgi:outer membrane protein
MEHATMKKTIRLLPITSLLLIAPFSFSASDLVQVYNDAIKSDPTYQAAKSTYLSAAETLPIARGALFPEIALTGGSNGLGYTTKTNSTGDLATNGDATTSGKGYGLALTLSQPLFNYTFFQGYSEAKNSEKQAAATYYNAQQNLMVRVSNAYFAILMDQDVVRYTQSNVEANKKSLDQAKQQFEVGLKTQTDVYTSQAAYSSAVSDNVSAKNTLANDQENLRAITGKSYKSLAKLSNNFPLAKPSPASINDWTKVAVEHNWDLQSYHYAQMAAMDEIKVQFGGHMPEITLNASYGHNYTYTNDHNSEAATGNKFANTATASIDFNLPLFEGGIVSGQVKQAEYDFQTAVHNMELEYRTVTTDTRQDYLNVISGISAINADKSSVQSNTQALKGLQAGYKVGTQTMVDVLNQQSLLFQAQQNYATDRYSYVDNLVSLKYDAGTLSAEDIAAINGWLGSAPAAKDKNKEQGKKLQSLSPRFKGDTPVKPVMTISATKKDDPTPENKAEIKAKVKTKLKEKANDSPPEAVTSE